MTGSTQQLIEQKNDVPFILYWIMELSTLFFLHFLQNWNFRQKLLPFDWSKTGKFSLNESYSECWEYKKSNKTNFPYFLFRVNYPLFIVSKNVKNPPRIMDLAMFHHSYPKPFGIWMNAQLGFVMPTHTPSWWNLTVIWAAKKKYCFVL